VAATLSSVEGPWALIFAVPAAGTVIFGRDPRGRRSALIALGAPLDRGAPTLDTDRPSLDTDASASLSVPLPVPVPAGAFVAGASYAGLAVSSSALLTPAPAAPDVDTAPAALMSQAAAGPAADFADSAAVTGPEERFAAWHEVPCTGIFTLRFYRSQAAAPPGEESEVVSGARSQAVPVLAAELDFAPWPISAPVSDVPSVSASAAAPAAGSAIAVDAAAAAAAAAADASASGGVATVSATASTAAWAAGALPQPPPPLPPLCRAPPSMPLSPAEAMRGLPPPLRAAARSLLGVSADVNAAVCAGGLCAAPDADADAAMIADADADADAVGKAASAVFLALLARSVRRRVALCEPPITPTHQALTSEVLTSNTPASETLTARPLLTDTETPVSTYAAPGAGAGASAETDSAASTAGLDPRHFGLPASTLVVDATPLLPPARIAIAFRSAHRHCFPTA
jgi:hypothetical protein